MLLGRGSMLIRGTETGCKYSDLPVRTNMKLGGKAITPYLARLLETSLNNATVLSDCKTAILQSQTTDPLA
jgi:hypothetical protein